MAAEACAPHYEIYFPMISQVTGDVEPLPVFTPEAYSIVPSNRFYVQRDPLGVGTAPKPLLCRARADSSSK